MKGLSQILIGLAFIGTGVMHFVRPKPFAAIVPPMLPAPLLLVYLSGVAEVLGGLGFLFPQTRYTAGIGLILLLIAVFPANVYMALRPEAIPSLHIAPVWLWLRLPLQFALIAWVWWAMQL